MLCVLSFYNYLLLIFSSFYFSPSLLRLLDWLACVAVAVVVFVARCSCFPNWRVAKAKEKAKEDLYFYLIKNNWGKKWIRYDSLSVIPYDADSFVDVCSDLYVQWTICQLMATTTTTTTTWTMPMISLMYPACSLGYYC